MRHHPWPAVIYLPHHLATLATMEGKALATSWATKEGTMERVRQ
jgi:hypothetical protein